MTNRITAQHSACPGCPEVSGALVFLQAVRVIQSRAIDRSVTPELEVVFRRILSGVSKSNRSRLKSLPLAGRTTTARSRRRDRRPRPDRCGAAVMDGPPCRFELDDALADEGTAAAPRREELRNRISSTRSGRLPAADQPVARCRQRRLLLENRALPFGLPQSLANIVRAVVLGLRRWQRACRSALVLKAIADTL